MAPYTLSDEATIDDNGMRSEDYDAADGTIADNPPMTRLNGDTLVPVRWGRHLDWHNVASDYQVVIQGDSSALVTYTKTVPGEFRVGYGIVIGDSVSIDTVVRKPFTETITRKVRFVRIARNNDPFRNWFPVAVTLSLGQTSGGNAFSIDSVQLALRHAGVTATYSDPLNTWLQLWHRNAEVPSFLKGDSVLVRVTLTSSDSVPEISALRHGIAGGRPERRRLKMKLVSSTPVGNEYVRVYERTFKTSMAGGRMMWGERFNLVVDVLSHGSIWSMSDPFSNVFWGIPYVVRGF